MQTHFVTVARILPSGTHQNLLLLGQIDNQKIEEIRKRLHYCDSDHLLHVWDGQYFKKDQLVSKNIIPQATYDKIKDLIVANRSSRAHLKNVPAR